MTLNLKQQAMHDIWTKVFSDIHDTDHYSTIHAILEKLDLIDLLSILPKEHRKKFEGYVINSDIFEK